MGNNSLDIPLVNNLSLRDQWRRANFHTGAIGAPANKKPGYMSFEAWKKSKGFNTGGKVGASSKAYRGTANIITGRD